MIRQKTGSGRCVVEKTKSEKSPHAVVSPNPATKPTGLYDGRK